MNLSQRCATVVVGAGPAGVAVVGNLLEKQPGAKIAWIDPSFQAGRLCKYREVPSNTKVGLFQQYATVLQPFRTVINTTPIPNAFSKLAKLDQEKTCHLHHAADMIQALTNGLGKFEQVHKYQGMVTAANLSEKNASWTVCVKGPNSPEETEIVTSQLILCTGSYPTLLPISISDLNIQRLDLDIVLKPSEIPTHLPQDTSPLVIAVIGASHSAILALLNLVDLARSSPSYSHLRINWFTRHPLRYAEYKDGWILRDNTGLKGMAADFARQQLEDDRLPTSEAGRFISKIDCGDGKELQQYRAHLPVCTHIVQAVGFTRNPLPELSVDGQALLEPAFDHHTGGFMGKDGRPVPGLYGAGIAFPEQVTDPNGNVEYAVGFWKFMTFIRRVCPDS